MRFWLLDRICSYEADTELTAIKNVSLTEDYLADHFPEFPVLPGVFMLEAATQASAWLVRLSENFAHSIVVLHEAKAVKFANFVTPGHTLRICVKQLKRDGNLVHTRFQGEVEGRTCVSGRLVLECSNLAEDHRWNGILASGSNSSGPNINRPSGDGSAEVDCGAERLAEYARTDQNMIDALRIQARILTKNIPTNILTKGEPRGNLPTKSSNGIHVASEQPN